MHLLMLPQVCEQGSESHLEQLVMKLVPVWDASIGTQWLNPLVYSTGPQIPQFQIPLISALFTSYVLHCHFKLCYLGQFTKYFLRAYCMQEMN